MPPAAPRSTLPGPAAAVRRPPGVRQLPVPQRQHPASAALSDHHDVLLISDGGTLVRTPAAHIAQVGRNTQGVTLMRVAKDEKLQAIERLDASLDEPADAVADAAAASVQADQPNAS